VTGGGFARSDWSFVIASTPCVPAISIGAVDFSMRGARALGLVGGNNSIWRADISFGVIHGRAKRTRAARRSEVVNNSAAGENIAGGRPASARSRSREGYRKTVNRRLPDEPEALAGTSNRTTPHEGHYISSMDGRAKRRQQQKLKSAPMNNPDQESGGWLEQRGFGGLDWASQKHSVVVVDPQGKVLEDFEIEHSALGLSNAGKS
jgi:hypothetical protein